jgi:prophage antirepressor-like protein
MNKKDPEIRIESWNNHSIRFVKKDDEWWAIAKDVCDALGFVESTGFVNANDMVKHLDPDEVSLARILCGRTISPTTSNIIKSFTTCSSRARKTPKSG